MDQSYLCSAFVIGSVIFAYAVSYWSNSRGVKAKPAGHPFGLLVVAFQLVPFLESKLHFELSKIFVGYSLLSVLLWGIALVRDLSTTRKALSALRDKPHILPGHEQIAAINMALKGISDVYVDLSGINTKILVDTKVEPERLAAEIAERLSAAGIKTVPNKSAAKNLLNVVIKMDHLVDSEKAIILVNVQIIELMTNDRLQKDNINMWLPLSSYVALIVSDDNTTAKSIEGALKSHMDKLIAECSAL